MIRQWSVSEISGPTVQIYMGGQGVNRLPPVQKKYVFGAPFHHFFCKKKAGDSGPLKSKRFALLTEFFLFCLFFWRWLRGGDKYKYLYSLITEILLRSAHSQA